MKIVVEDDGVSLSGSVHEIMFGYMSLSEEINKLMNSTAGKNYSLEDMFFILSAAVKEAVKEADKEA
jgi:hypothetical protein